MILKKSIARIILIIILATGSRAAKPFRIPEVRVEALTGSWSLVSLSKTGAGEEELVKVEEALEFVFRADGSGLERVGAREKNIRWGGDDKGRFAYRWKQDDENGDGVMGKWETIGTRVKLTVRQYENGAGGAGDQLVVILEKVGRPIVTEELTSSLLDTWKENRVFLGDGMKRLNVELAESRKVILDPATPLREKESAIQAVVKSLVYFPGSTRELVPVLAKMLGDKEVDRGTKKSIMSFFAGMGPRASGASEAMVEYIKDNFPDPSSDRRASVIMKLGRVAPGNDFYLQEATKFLDHPDLEVHGRMAMSLLRAGNKNKKVISLVKEGIEGTLEMSGILAVARAAGLFTEDERKAFAEVVRKFSGSYKGYTSNLAYYAIASLRGDIPKAMEAFGRSLNEESLVVIGSWSEMAFLSDAEFKQLTPVLVGKMKEDPKSSKIFSFAFRLSELSKKEGLDRE